MCIFTKVFKVDKKHLQYSSTRAKIGSMKQAFKTAGVKKLPPSGFSRLSVLYYTPLQQGKECFPKETLFVLFCHTFPLPRIPITRDPLGKEDKLWGGFGFCWGFGPGAPWGCWPRRWFRPGGCGNGSSSWRNCPIHGTSRQRCGGAPLFFARFPLPGYKSFWCSFLQKAAGVARGKAPAQNSFITKILSSALFLKKLRNIELESTRPTA